MRLDGVRLQTYRIGGEGKGKPAPYRLLAIYEKTDPAGGFKLYEALSCASGVVHATRVLSSQYIAIHRK